MSRKECLEKIKQLPMSPGVYIMKDRAGKIIYVGKAKKLYNRVGQYFVGNHAPKVQRMADQIWDFDYIVAPSETQALILENNLIKLHRPKYNILLKDDKSYPYLAMDCTLPWPRLTLCRRRAKDGKVYFGPFASGKTVRDIKRQTEQLFGLVTCLPKVGAKPCLSADMGHCCAPCTGKITKEEYRARVDRALSFLKGDYKKTLAELKDEMMAAAEKMEFEKAAALRDRIRSIEKLGEQQIMVLAPDMDEDVFGLAESEDKQCVSVLQIREGRLCRQEQFFFETPEDGVLSFIQQYYDDLSDIPPRIICAESADETLIGWLEEKREGKVRFVSPRRGEHLKLLQLAEKNATEGLQLRRSVQQRINRTSVSLGEFLGLSQPPTRIEMYDISNFGEDAMVGGMIVWQKGGLKKNQYRHFIIKEQGQIDDYAATRQILSRRLADYKAGKEGFETPPDVIVMDGGKGHIDAVEDLVREALPRCALFGAVKDGRHRTRALVTPEGEEIGLNVAPQWFKFFAD
ncbi:MAG: excinuclease ABC subunit UvrC, partial [Clostridia bacterium]|nr:excinuclease ABC subunit UvrC [Clostridia bacterium]